jgi:hypothetical protein
MLKIYALLTLACFLAAIPASAESIIISKDIYDADKLDFIPHNFGGKWGNYLSMEIPFKPVKEVLHQIENITGQILKNRGEAHITVVTPIEYWALGEHLSIDEINKIALENNIQQANFKILGIGQGIKENQETYFIVVQSRDLFEIRDQIHQKFIQNGGDKDKFVPAHFFPHITVGFTHRDLHEADNVIKGKNSLVYPVKFK